jgi:hypothetical protein
MCASSHSKVDAVEQRYVVNSGVRGRGGLGKKVFPGRKSFSKSEVRKNREETPAYLHGSWECVGREPRFFRSPVSEMFPSPFPCPAFAIITGVLKHLLYNAVFTEPPSTIRRSTGTADRGGLVFYSNKGRILVYYPIMPKHCWYSRRRRRFGLVAGAPSGRCGHARAV